MAVCLAVIVDDHIVVCSDEEVGAPLNSNKETIQDRPLSHGWRALVAARAPSSTNIVPHLEISFSKIDSEDASDIFEAINRGLRSYKKALIDEYVGSTWGQTYDEFRQTKHLYADATYKAETDKLRDTCFDAEALVIGFARTEGSLPEPLIFHVGADWKVETHDNFFAIGEASLAAQLSLLSRGIPHKKYSLEQTVFLSFEAKKIAECAPVVGAATTLTVYSADGSARHISSRTESHLANLFAAFGPRPLKDNLNIADFIAFR